MASPAAAPTPDTLVTIKVNIEGSNRRLKLPLRDLGAQTLPDKLRFLLAIPPSAEVIFERYSDSAASFVTLDPTNASVYKQLNRAARAKLKLRLRVTIKEADPKPVAPRQATVEDDVIEEQALVPEVPQVAQPREPVVEALESQRGCTFVQPSSITPSHPRCLWAANLPTATTSHEIPVTRGACNRDKFLADIAGLKMHREIPFHPRPVSVSTHVGPYSVYCNKCNEPIPDEHFHCDTCDDGDFDLCQSCIDKGVLCNDDSHWMIKRSIKNGKVVTSVTATLEPRSRPQAPKAAVVEEPKQASLELPIRTCNSCVQEYPENNFVTCTTCDDYDLCFPCHTGLQHGHDPKHGFAPAVPGTDLEAMAEFLLDPGRNFSHYAICDGCDRHIYGIRHKCLDCPDWDYCNTCIKDAEFVHPTHRFVPVYEALSTTSSAVCVSQQKHSHHGIYCDGPLCLASSSYIRGIRYKCAVCHDTDFCANCEASPSNTHNRTHPLIKFKTPVRNVSVTTMGDHVNGQPMPIMGDRISRTSSKSTETTNAATNAATQVRTVADLKPTGAVASEENETEPAKTKIEAEESKPVEPKIETAKELLADTKPAVEEELVAHFVRDSVVDGTIMAPNTVFEQTWVLRNGGSKPWPAGCTVKFVGGDNMCANDPDHPASVHELVSAAESTTCYSEIAAGQAHGFTVLLRTPSRPGKVISYWRLTGPTGMKFGHRLWCDVTVEEAKAVEEVNEVNDVEAKTETEGSQMIFPKLEKESPESSVHHEAAAVEENSDVDDFGDVADEDFDDTEDGFLTDEEYDVLDASDEEYLADQERASKK